jgi:hypothetical protein
MRKSDFTAGPWAYQSAEVGVPLLRIICADGDHPANESRGYEEKEANAKLMAAAPDLLEALQELRDLMQGVIDGDYEPDSLTLKIADAAIAKATA